MSSIIWTPDALSSEAQLCKETVWRMVEAQHIVSTMRWVDTMAEQDLLEEILEESKPPLPDATEDLDNLLAAPFRYAAFAPGSRFRGPSDPGVFYGAECVRTASAEAGYWRWRFLRDTVGLERLGPTQHTAFSVPIDANSIDLRNPSFRSGSAVWAHPSDYSGTQAFANVAREAEIDAVFYRSVRDPIPSWCIAILTPVAFAAKQADSATQTWQLVVTQNEVIWRRGAGRERYLFETSYWG